MIKYIIKKELNDIVRNKRILFFLGIIIFLTVIALYNGKLYLNSHSHMFGKAQKESYEQFVNQGEKNPHSGAHYGFYAFKPISLMSALERGIDEYLGTVFWMEAHKQGEVKVKEINDSSSLRRLGFLNIGYILQFIIPLFIFVLTYSIFSKEWENGTIKMLLSTKIDIKHLFIAKFIATFIIILVVVSFILIISALMFCINNYGQNVIDFFANIVTLFLFLILFYSSLLLIGISISLWLKKSSTSLITLVAFWLVGVFLVPRFSSEIANNIYPNITSIKFDEQVKYYSQNGLDGKTTYKKRSKKMLQDVLKKYNVKSEKELPINFSGYRIQKSEEYSAKIFDKCFGDVFNNFKKQNAFVKYSSVFSPFIAFRDLSMSIAGTDLNSHLSFTKKTEEHRRIIQKIINDYYEKNSIANINLWKSVPQFKHNTFSLVSRLKNSGLSIAVILVWLFISTVFSLNIINKNTVLK
ncbi:MAG: DUF3526 domain-containing protein [Tenacibaculum sp.]|nr:DUF3526 domain-containing protein [Tenacibaculum sp.]